MAAPRCRRKRGSPRWLRFSRFEPNTSLSGRAWQGKDRRIWRGLPFDLLGSHARCPPEEHFGGLSGRKSERHVQVSNPVKGGVAMLMTVGSGAKAKPFGYFVHPIPADFGMAFLFEGDTGTGKTSAA